MFKCTSAIVNLLLASIVAIACFLIWTTHELKLQGPLTEEKILVIEQKTSVLKIADQLQTETVISETIPFIVKAKLSKAPLQAGEYQFEPGITMKRVLEKLQKGETYQRSITLPEGLTSKEIIDLINSHPYLKGDIITAIPPEGSLLPETYNFTFGDTKQSIVTRMEKAMAETIQKLWNEHPSGLELKDVHEALTLASIVEKETAIKDERPRVAGVFMNRLRKGIPLQTDPTVIYAITMGKEKLDRELTTKDLKTQSPFNTYVTKGLPPTPIANPGKESIAAAMNPEYNDYIYFVADGTGGHVFAKTLKEHNENVSKWRKIKKSTK